MKKQKDGYWKPNASKITNKVIKIKSLKEDEVPASEKQINYICFLLNKNKIRGYFHRERDGKRLSIKQASNLIDCLLYGIPFKFKDVDLEKERWKNNLSNP